MSALNVKANPNPLPEHIGSIAIAKANHPQNTSD